MTTNANTCSVRNTWAELVAFAENDGATLSAVTEMWFPKKDHISREVLENLAVCGQDKKKLPGGKLATFAR